MLAPYLLTFTEGILTFISPCILPMLPIYFIYLAGSSQQIENNQQAAGNQPAMRGDHPAAAGNDSAAPGSPAAAEKYPQNTGNDPATTGSSILPNSVGFVAGFTIVFILLGAAATSLGIFLKDNRLIMQRISGLIMVVFGLNFAGLIRIRLLNREKRFEIKIEKLNFLKSVLFGMVFGLGWSPCLGAFLGSALLMAGSSGTMTQGLLLLLIYSAGLGIPFIISSIIFENIKGAFAWLNRHSRAISIISGVLLIGAGLLIFLDILKYL